MRVQMFRQARTWAAGALLLSGLVYSVLALTLTARPAYAAACTPAQCFEGEQDAGEFCASKNSRMIEYICPFGTNQSGWFAECLNGDADAGLCSD
jgi:hypothetical protein